MLSELHHAGSAEQQRAYRIRNNFNYAHPWIILAALVNTVAQVTKPGGGRRAPELVDLLAVLVSSGLATDGDPVRGGWVQEGDVHVVDGAELVLLVGCIIADEGEMETIICGRM